MGTYFDALVTNIILKILARGQRSCTLDGNSGDIVTVIHKESRMLQIKINVDALTREPREVSASDFDETERC